MFIREMAKRTGVSSDTLRYYERIGLIPPVPRNRGGIRHYDESHIQYVAVIRNLKKSGMSLDDIQTYLELAKKGEETVPQRKALLRATKEQLQEKIQRMQCAVAMADFQLQHDQTMLAVPLTR